MRAIIHLGTYKTGSSSFQNLCWDNREALRQRDILYPETGVRNYRMLGMRHANLPYSYSKNGGKPLPQPLVEEIERSGCDTLIISSEALSNPSHLSFVNRFIFELREMGFDDVVGVGVFRNLGRYQSGLYREFSVNQTNVLPYRKFIHKPAGMFDYLYLLRSWRGLFEGNLKTLDYNDISDVRAAIFEAGDIKIDVNEMASPDWSNISRYDAIDAEICRQLNKIKSKDIHPKVRKALDKGKPSAWAKNWTERFEGDVPAFSDAYIERFCQLAGWTGEQGSRLFDRGYPQGQHVSSVSDEIASLIAALRE